MADLLTPLDPLPADAARPGGTIRLIGDETGSTAWQEGLCAGLECWVPRLNAWVPLGDVILGGNVGSLMLYRGRLSVTISFDLGAMKIRPDANEDEE